MRLTFVKSVCLINSLFKSTRKLKFVLLILILYNIKVLINLSKKFPFNQQLFSSGPKRSFFSYRFLHLLSEILRNENALLVDYRETWSDLRPFIPSMIVFHIFSKFCILSYLSHLHSHGLPTINYFSSFFSEILKKL